jgi:hypothetical protein
MKLKRVEISEDERAKLLAQHQQRVERHREEIERAASGQTAGAKFVDWQNPEWDVLESQAKSSDEGDGGFPAGELPQGLEYRTNRCNGQIHRLCECGGWRL